MVLTREDLPDPTLPVTHRSSPALTLKSMLRNVKESLLPPSEPSSEEPGRFTTAS